MGYMLPLRFIKVAAKPKVAICATRIVAMMSTDIYQARRIIHDEKKAGTLINACGTNAAKTAILLDNGSVVASPLTISIIVNSIEKSNIKASAKNGARLKVYDVFDEEPNPELDDMVTEMNGFVDEEDDEEETEEENEYEILTDDDDDDDDDDYYDE